MAIKNYMINDKWLDIAKQNIVEVESTDGVIGSVKVNGEEYGGGGGSSDFSTAEVTIVNNSSSVFDFIMATKINGDEMGLTFGMLSHEMIGTGMTTDVILYKGTAGMFIQKPLGVALTVAISGNIQDSGDGNYIITGGCTITIS